MNIKTALGVVIVLWILALFALPGHAGYLEYEKGEKCAPDRFYSVREMVLCMVEEAGFDREVADAVITCESGWNPGAIGDSGKSWGLWQIHQPAHNLGSASFDPYQSTLYAIGLLRSNRSWGHWSCHRKLFLP